MTNWQNLKNSGRFFNIVLIMQFNATLSYKL